jgi:hypothetical protein
MIPKKDGKRRLTKSAVISIIVVWVLLIVCLFFAMYERTRESNDFTSFEATYDDDSIPGGEIKVSAGWIESLQGYYIVINETIFTSVAGDSPTTLNSYIEIGDSDIKKLKNTLNSFDSEYERYNYLSFMRQHEIFYGSKAEYEKAFGDWYDAKEVEDEAKHQEYLKEQEAEKALKERESAKARKEADEKFKARQAEIVSDEDAALAVFEEMFSSEDYLSVENLSDRTRMVKSVLDDWRDYGTFSDIEYSYNPNENHFVIHGAVDKTCIYFVLDVENNLILTEF